MASEELTTQLTAAQAFASSSYSSAEALVSSAQTVASGRVTLNPQNLDTVNTPDPSINAGILPFFLERYYAPNSRPSSPSLVSRYLPERPTFPTQPDDLDLTGLFDFDKPVWDVESFDGVEPEINVDQPLPSVPVPVWPDAPTPLTLTVRDAPTPNIPTFDEELEAEDPGAPPSDLFAATYESIGPTMRDWLDSYLETFYLKYAPGYSTLQEALEAKLAADLSGGGTAITDSIEQQIFNRARDRAEAERERLDQEVLRSGPMRGMSEMPGEVEAGLRRNMGQVGQNSAMSAAETAIERAKLEQQHIQFVMQIISELNRSVLNAGVSYAQMLVSINGQALQYSEQVANNAFKIYELALRRYELVAGVLKIAAEVYEVRVKSALAELEAYRIEIEGKKLQGELKQIEVDLYGKRIAAEEAKINAAVQQIKAIVEAAALQKLKLDLFIAQIQAHTSEIDGKRAEFNAYESAIRGDTARVAAQSEVVRTYGIGVDAARTFVDAERLFASTISEYNRDLLEEFKTELEGYRIDTAAEKERYTAESDIYRLALEKYKARLQTKIEEKKLEFSAADMDLRQALAQLEADLTVLQAQGRLFAESIKLNAETAMAGSSVFGRIAEGAVSANNSLVGLTEEVTTAGA